MLIAKIVSSNSHIEYIGRVIDQLDSADAPSSKDYGFGTFVAVDDVVGVIFNSILVNPDYANFGPRLSMVQDLEVFSPDFINERGVLINILMLGTIGGGHQIPEFVIEPGAEVRRLTDSEMLDFHKTKDGSLSLGYFSQVTENAGIFAVPLLKKIIERLAADCGEGERQKLRLLRDSLNWQQTVGGRNFR